MRGPFVWILPVTATALLLTPAAAGPEADSHLPTSCSFPEQVLLGAQPLLCHFTCKQNMHVNVQMFGALAEVTGECDTGGSASCNPTLDDLWVNCGENSVQRVPSDGHGVCKFKGPGYGSATCGMVN
jgi:hypothetical protein